MYIDLDQSNYSLQVDLTFEIELVQWFFLVKQENELSFIDPQNYLSPYIYQQLMKLHQCFLCEQVLPLFLFGLNDKIVQYHSGNKYGKLYLNRIKINET